MKRPAFFSFHYENDAWRASQVRNIGVVDGNVPVSDNDWETVKCGGGKAIARWIDEQLKYKQVVIVLIGYQTANRPWVKYEIERAWELGKPMLGIFIHGLKNEFGNTAHQGQNPFDKVTAQNGEPLSRYVYTYNPAPYGDSKAVYNEIMINLGYWVETAINQRKTLAVWGV